MRPLQKGSFCLQRCSQMLIYYFINCALLPSWEQKIALFARGLKLCKTLIHIYSCNNFSHKSATRDMDDIGLRHLLHGGRGRLALPGSRAR